MLLLQAERLKLKTHENKGLSPFGRSALFS